MIFIIKHYRIPVYKNLARSVFTGILNGNKNKIEWISRHNISDDVAQFCLFFAGHREKKLYEGN